MTHYYYLTMRISRDSARQPGWQAFKDQCRPPGPRDEHGGFFTTERATNNTLDTLPRLAACGYCFYGHHSTGSAIGARAFYAISNRFIQCAAGDDGRPVIQISVDGPVGARMIEPEKALGFANQLARVTVLIDQSWKPDRPRKKARLTVV